MGQLIVWKLKDLCEVIDQMIQNKFDCIIFIEGNRGTGKSTIAIKISSRLKNTVKFNPERDIYFSRKSILRAIATKQRRIVFGDELINVGFNRDFYIEEQKQLIKALNMYRDSCNVFIGCIPKFVTLDKQLQGLCKIRITVLERGIALIQTQVPSIYTNDPWDIQNNQKIEAKWTLKGTKNPRYSQLTTVRGILRFKDLNPKRRERYERIKHEKRNKIFMEENELGIELDLNKIFYQNLIEQLKTGTLNKQEFEKICLVSGKKVGGVRARLSQLLNQQGISGGVSRLLAGEEEKEEEVNPTFNNEVR